MTQPGHTSEAETCQALYDACCRFEGEARDARIQPHDYEWCFRARL